MLRRQKEENKNKIQVVWWRSGIASGRNADGQTDGDDYADRYHCFYCSLSHIFCRERDETAFFCQKIYDIQPDFFDGRTALYTGGR